MSKEFLEWYLNLKNMIVKAKLKLNLKICSPLQYWFTFIISVIACFIFQIVLKFLWKYRTSISKIRNFFGFQSCSQQHDTENSHEFDRVMTNALKNKKEIEY